MTEHPQSDSRRRFLRQSAGGAVAVGLGSALEGDAVPPVDGTIDAPRVCVGAAGAVLLEAAEEPLDVFVAGGGPAGLTAAIQAARLGARVLLVEKSGVLGGTTVLNGVSLPGLFHAWGRQVIAGIGWELVTRAVDLAGDGLPDFTDYNRPHPLLQVPVNRALYAALADEMLLDAGAGVLLHAMPLTVAWRDGLWRITLATKEGPRVVSARVAIDCTGDANLAGLAGFERRRSEAPQPGTLILQTDGYDPDALNEAALMVAHARALDEGGLMASDLAGRSPMSFLRARGNNAMHVIDIDGATSEGKTRAEFLARQTMLRIYRFFRAQPGLERFHIAFFATECGIRETWTIRGKATVTAQDYTTGRVWEDALCYSFYPVDVHRASGHGIRIEPLREGIVPTIPRRAMLPADSRCFMVAGRCIAGDQDANSAYRVQASCMAMGQAAGAVAALAARASCDVEEVPLGDVHAALREHGAIVPDVT